MTVVEENSPALRAIELLADLVKQGRMSRAEARVFEEILWHPLFPQKLRERSEEPKRAA